MNLFNENIEDNSNLSKFRESDWEAMQKLLEEKEDSKKPFYFWWIGSSFLLAIFVSAFFLFGNKEEQNLIRLNEEKSQLKILLPDLETLSTKQNIDSMDFDSNSMNFPKNITKQKIAFMKYKIERIKSEKKQTKLDFKNTKLEENRTQLGFSNTQSKENTTQFLEKKIDSLSHYTDSLEKILFINRINIDSLFIETSPIITTNKNFIAPPKLKLKRLTYGIYVGTNAEIRAANGTKYLPEIGFLMNYKLSKHYFIGARLTYLAKLSTTNKIEIDYTEKEINSFNESLSQNSSTNADYTPSVYDTIQFQYYQNSLHHYLNLPLYFGYQKANHQFSAGVNNRLYIGEYQWKVKNEKTTAQNFFNIASNISPVANYSLSLHGGYSYQLNKKWRVETQILREVYHKNQTAKNWQIGIGVTYLLSK